LLAGVLGQDDARVLAAHLERSALLPVKLDELLGDVVNLQLQWCPRVVAPQHAQIGKSKEKGELVAGDELALGQQSLDVPQE
jgi:hypothetical protein